LVIVFQSAPAIDGGRSSCWPFMAPLPGAFQSAPAIDGGRSVGCEVGDGDDHWFQSAPAIDGGRSRVGLEHLLGPQLVSIRARHRWRAIPRAICIDAIKTGFQSAPAIDGGRSPAFQSWARRPSCFNPRPPSMAGDPHQASATTTRMRGFNPRPPSMAGDPVSLRFQMRRQVVSIRARHRWRAIPVRIGMPRNEVSFQSAPAIDGGRSRPAAARRRAVRCFNPRPPSMAGDPGAGAQGRGVGAVSIRARHRWRAIRFARNSLLSNHIFDVQREHDDQAHLVARRRHKSTDQFQQTQ